MRSSVRTLAAAPRTPENPENTSDGTPQFNGSVAAAPGYSMPAFPATFCAPANEFVDVLFECVTLSVMLLSVPHFTMFKVIGAVTLVDFVSPPRSGKTFGDCVSVWRN